MNRQRIRIALSGAVQGVGFRPFVYHLAREMRLDGWVSNSTQGVLIEVEGNKRRFEEFLERIETDKPPAAEIQKVEYSFLRPVPYAGFEIRESNGTGARTAVILPDLAACSDCLHEMFDPNDRRYLYPFTNCTHCGPRFSIIEALPYDRANTSMKQFAMCTECSREYHDPRNRRFHAQPNACPRCGPRLELWEAEAHPVCRDHDAVTATVALVREGKIVALKGIGGFQLLVDARSEKAVQRLRERKRREGKPFALMFPSLEAIQKCCHLTNAERELLLSPASPIVLLKKLPGENSQSIAQSVAAGNPWLGSMLPYSPLHHLLLRELGFPVVATSGNLSDEPICTDEREAFDRLRGIADAFLVHNRPIVRHVDDSVARVMGGREMVLRRSRGYAPMPIAIKSEPSHVGSYKVLGVGAHLKNAVALAASNQVFIGQHIGDLETAPAYEAFRKSAADLPRLYEASSEVIACDLHPEYLSTKFALERRCSNRRDQMNGAPMVFPVQHHYAHILSCMADNELSAPVLGVAWDGTGFGTDGSIWGGEFLLVDENSFERFAHFRQFRLPGGDAAVKEPRRSALGLLHEMFGQDLFARRELSPLQYFSQSELQMLERMLTAGVNSPVTSSAGRLFDAVASMIGLRQRASFEGQAAMDLEFAASEGGEGSYSLKLRNSSPMIFDWGPMVAEILQDLGGKKMIGNIAAKFHNTLAELVVAVARVAGQKNVVLSGGCFQNQYLTERIIRRLRKEAFIPQWHQRIPPSDGGIALGQVVAARRALAQQSKVGSKPDGSAAQLAPQLAEPISRL